MIYSEVDCWEKLYGESALSVPHYRKNPLHCFIAKMNNYFVTALWAK